MVNFLREKSNTFDTFEALFVKLLHEKNYHLKKVIIRSDHGREFENSLFTGFCNKDGIRHECKTWEN